MLPKKKLFFFPLNKQIFVCFIGNIVSELVHSVGKIKVELDMKECDFVQCFWFCFDCAAMLLLLFGNRGEKSSWLVIGLK